MASSKLSSLCDALIEAGWLGVAVIVPLYFTGYTNTGFDADKLTFLDSIALVMVAAWLIKWVDQRGWARSPAKMSLRSPFVLPTLGIALAYLLATFTSIAPQTSIFGEYTRPQGTYALLSCIVIFAMIAQGLRTRQQLERLLLAIIITSIPISLYSVLQRFELDPLRWSFDMNQRAGANLGNPIFLGAYLIMVFFLTIAKILDCQRARVQAESPVNRRVQTLGLILYALIAVVQAIGLLLSNSRGPWIGWFAGAVLFFLLLALVAQRRRMVLALMGLGAVGVLAIGIMNVPNTPLDKIQDRGSMLYKMSHLFTATDQKGVSSEGRLPIWVGVARLVMPHAPLQFPDGTPDRLNSIRPLVGYGPDSLGLVIDQFRTADPGMRALTIDRSHNETWQTLADTGLIGLVAYQVIILCVFLFGLWSLGLVSTNRMRNLFVGLWLGWGMLGGLIPIIFGQFLYIGVGIPIGNAIGLGVYLAWLAFTVQNQPAKSMLGELKPLLLIALLGGFFAHYIESQLGIDVIVTRTMFWLEAGLLIVIGSATVDLETEDVVTNQPMLENKPSVRFSSGTMFILSFALIIGLILSTLFFGFMLYDRAITSPVDFLWHALAYNSNQGNWSYGGVGLILVFAVLAGATVFVEKARLTVAGRTRPKRTESLFFVGLSFGLAIVFGLGIGVLFSALANISWPISSVAGLMMLSTQLLYIFDWYILGVSVFLVLMTLCLSAPVITSSQAWIANRLTLVVVIPVILIAGWWINYSNLSPIQADICYKVGQDNVDAKYWDGAIAMFKRALALAPNNDVYVMALGRSFREKAYSANTTATSVFTDQTGYPDILNLDIPRINELDELDLFLAAQILLTRARDLNPLYPLHTLNLARLYLVYADLPITLELKAKMVEQANQYYAQALRSSPTNVLYWNEWSVVDVVNKNDPDAALVKLETSQKLDPLFEETYTYKGEAYRVKRDYVRAIEAFNFAIQSYQLSLDFDVVNSGAGDLSHRVPDLAKAYFGLIEVYKDQQNFDQAAAGYETLIKKLNYYTDLALTNPKVKKNTGLFDQIKAVQVDVVKAQSRVAFVYTQQNKFPEAIQAYQQYIALAPQADNLWEAHKNLALLYEQSGNLNLAIQEAETALQLTPTDIKPQMSDLVGRLRAKAGLP